MLLPTLLIAQEICALRRKQERVCARPKWVKEGRWMA